MEDSDFDEYVACVHVKEQVCAVEKPDRNVTYVFAQKNFQKDIFTSKICYRYDLLLTGSRVVQFREQSCSYFQIDFALRAIELFYTLLDRSNDYYVSSLSVLSLLLLSIDIEILQS